MLFRTHELGFSFSNFPLLGREQEMDLYSTLLQTAKEFCHRKEKTPDFFKMVIIRGDFRQGKTRLLEEILYTSDPTIPIHTFTLTPFDREVSN